MRRRAPSVPREFRISSIRISSSWPHAELDSDAPDSDPQVPEVGRAAEVELGCRLFVRPRRVKIPVCEHPAEHLVLSRRPERNPHRFIDPGRDRCGPGGRSAIARCHPAHGAPHPPPAPPPRPGAGRGGGGGGARAPPGPPRATRRGGARGRPPPRRPPPRRPCRAPSRGGRVHRGNNHPPHPPPPRRILL